MEKNSIPECIGVAEDSGFASIIGSVTTETSDDRVSIDNTWISGNEVEASDAKIQNAKVLEKKKNNEAKAEAKREADAQYNREKVEQTFKRLKHLHSKSQFYSEYINGKMNNTDKNKASKPNKKRKRSSNIKQPKDDEIQSIKRSKRIANGKKIDSSDQSISNVVEKSVHKKVNLSIEEIEEELNTESDSEETESPTADGFIKPKYFVGDLYQYQHVGLQWLKLLYENGVSGILADEMGLGKTIQVIALMCYLVERRQSGPHLILVPLSTLSNWVDEFAKFAPSIPVLLLYGSAADRTKVLKKINLKVSAGEGHFKTKSVVITTYEVAFREKYNLSKHHWRYIIIDEGHRIKNYKCQLINVLKLFKSMNRLILTGTPLQNNLAELWSLLNFLEPDLFDDLDVFESWFNAKELQDDKGTERFLKQEEEKHVMSTLREILKPFMLRREKNAVHLDIPPKKELIVYAPITELQRDLYAATLNRDFDKLTKVENQVLIVNDENGVKPKRRCLSRHKYSSAYVELYGNTDNSLLNGTASMNSMSSLLSYDDSREHNRPQVSENSENDKNKADREAQVLEIWKKYGNVTDRNRDFYVYITMNNRLAMYKKIINHPYLVHWPLDGSGLPEVNENLVKVSGKLLILDAMLKKLYACGHRVLLFSTMTQILDVLADYLTLRPWKYVRLDGDLKNEDRKTTISSFNSDPSIFLFLISTRAGGVGLNLASADTVIIYDSDWNPQADLQAMARCHRIGQTRPVAIYKLCAKGTIDEVILQRAEAKRKLEKMVISKDIALHANKPETILELKHLLESTESESVASENKMFTDAELDKLLDRSDLQMAKQLDSDCMAGTSKEITNIK